MDQPRILVSLPLYGGICYDRFLNSWTDLLQWGFHQGIDFSLQVISNESLLPRARNLGVATLLDGASKYTHILFVDGDMGFKPHRFERLLQWNKPMVGCPGPAKFIYWENIYDAVINGYDIKSHCLRYAVNFLSTEGVQPEQGFAKVRDFGCCFLLVQTQALVEMAERYPDLRCTDMSHVNGMPVQSKNTFTFFDTARDENARYLECDHAFMYRWRKLGEGHDVWADLTGDMAHVGTMHFEGSMSEYFFKERMGTQIQAITTPWGSELPPLPAGTTEAVTNG